VELYQGLNDGLAIYDVTGLSSLQTFWAQGNNATTWPASSLPASLTSLRLNDNALPEAEVDSVLSQAASAPLANATVDLSGTTMANASSTGWGHKDTLESAGCTVLLSGTDPRQGTPPSLVWKPGHYLLTPYDDNVIQNWLTEYAGTIIRGFNRQAHWIELEAVKDDYSALYAFLDKYMGMAATAAPTVYGDSLGFCFRFQTKLFNNNITRYPSYLHNHVLTDDYGNYYAPWWDAYIQERMELMFEKIAQHVGTDSHFRCLMLPETSVSGHDSAQKAAYCEGQAYLGVRMHEILTNHPSAAYFNSGPSEFVYYEEAAPLGCGLGSPDVYAAACDTDGYACNGYTLRQSLSGIAFQHQEVQTWNYAVKRPGVSNELLVNEEGYVDPQYHFDFVKSFGIGNYMSWTPHIDWINTGVAPAVKALILDIEANQHPGDPAGGLMSGLPTSLQA